MRRNVILNNKICSIDGQDFTMYCLDAEYTSKDKVEIRGWARRVVPTDDCLKQNKKSRISKNELVIRISLPEGAKIR